MFAFASLRLGDVVTVSVIESSQSLKGEFLLVGILIVKVLNGAGCAFQTLVHDTSISIERIGSGGFLESTLLVLDESKGVRSSCFTGGGLTGSKSHVACNGSRVVETSHRLRRMRPIILVESYFESVVSLGESPKDGGRLSRHLNKNTR